MKLTSFGIANFKAFGSEMQHIPLKPITLVFGPNSAGKSSLIHSLLWTADAMEQNSLDVRVSKRVSGTLDLGGFLSVLRAHDTKNKIRISVGADNLPSGEPIQINLQIGIRTQRDLDDIYEQEWLQAHPDWDKMCEFNETAKTIESAVDTFSVIWCYNGGSTDELDVALSSEEAWEKENEHHRLREKEMEWDHTPLPALSEARALYAEAQQAWNRRRELAPKVVPILKNLYQQFTEVAAKENQTCSVLSCEIRIGNRCVLEATRRLGSNRLTVNPTTFDPSIWKQNPDEVVSAGERIISRLGGSRSVSNCFENITFQHPSVEECSDVEQWSNMNRAIQWLVSQFDQIAKQLGGLVVVGPLRALPSRRELLGYASDSTRDPLLMPWLRLRDDESVLNAVNESLKSITKTHLTFWRASYGRIARMMDIEDEMPADPLGRIFLHLSGPKTTKWDEPGFFEGYNRHPAELIVREEGPFYKEVKDDDPDLAVRLVERELTKWLPHEILFDLLLRDELSGVEVKPQDVGVGISQIAPVLVQAFGNQNGLIAVEQPEIHIHPALQAELGDVFIESALGENKNTFLLETHSEHLILRILRRIRETTKGKLPDGLNPVKPEDVAVLYVEPGEEGSVVRELRINDQGRFIDDWPNGFFEDRLDELI